MKKNKKVPRGIRNRNPLNIRIGNVWHGEVLHPTDPDFEQFVAFEYGIRAAFVILRRYIRRYHHNTISKIVSTWAPTSENNVNSYVKDVATRMGIDPDTPILYEDKDTMCALVDAMIWHENSERIPLATIYKAYDMA